MKLLFLAAQYLVPHHLLSRLAGWFADSRQPLLKNFLIRRFIRAYGVNMAEAEYEESEAYACFNDFFTRALKQGARPVAEEAGTVVAPADGVVNAVGEIAGDRMIQAKGRDYSLLALLGGSAETADLFHNGHFATVYLAPRDYHRVHMPFSGTLREMTYIPGRLFSVNATTTGTIPNLFTRNERAVCLFDTEAGPMAVILVGAMIVAGIETVWAGRITPGIRRLQVSDYRRRQPAVHIGKGLELGRFRLGSTVIVLFGPGAVKWSEEARASWKVRMGQRMGSAVFPERR